MPEQLPRLLTFNTVSVPFGQTALVASRHSLKPPDVE
jgi:hypothetical protein